MIDHVEEIKHKLSIVDVVGGYVKLERAGKNMRARCPFHNEKTPSFYVSPERGSFVCFGCGAKGDMFTFVERIEGVDFGGALRTLAERAGVELTPIRGGKDKNEREREFEILEDATLFFEEKLAQSEPAKAYVASRGIHPQTVKIMRIGYAPAEWRSLREYLKSRGWADREMEKTGLIKKTDKATSDPFYDVFRDRIVFPIADASGRIVAFSGRIVTADPKAPKYLNSPETDLYRKSRILYGLDKAKQRIREMDYAILVEGQMDLVMSHQAGLRNTVASSGTALSDEEVRDGEYTGLGLITRLTKNIIIAFDSDSAGIKAALRAARISISLGMDTKIAFAKGGKDPAEIIQTEPKAWADILKNARPVVEFATERLLERKLSHKDLDRGIKDEILPLVAMSDSALERSRMLNVVSTMTGAKVSHLEEDVSKIIEKERLPNKGVTSTAPLVENSSREEKLERLLFGILYAQDETLKELDLSIRQAIGNERLLYYEALPEIDRSTIATEVESMYVSAGPQQKDVDDMILNLKLERTKRRRDEVGREMRLAVGSPRYDALIKEFEMISKEISDITNKLSSRR